MEKLHEDINTAVSIPRPLVKSTYQKMYFSYFSTKTYVVGTQKNRLNETVLFEHPKHMIKLSGKKIFTILRSKILFMYTCTDV